MSADAVTCEYIFTMAEFRRAAKAHRRHGHFPAATFAVCMIVAFSIITSCLLSPGPSKETSWAWFALLNFGPPAVIIVVYIYTFWFSGPLVFRKSPNYNQAIEYVISSDGLTLRMPLGESNIRWEYFVRVVEEADGFILFPKGKRAINWLPKDGFESPQHVLVAREILRDRVSKANRTSVSKSP